MTIRSKSGHEINVCCASCQHKQITNKYTQQDAVRVCQLTGQDITAHMVCDMYEAREDLMDI